MANRLVCQGSADNDAEEDMVGNSSNVSRSDVSSAPLFNEAQPGASSSSSSLEIRGGNVSGSFQVMMMSDNVDDDDDDDDDDDLEDIEAKFAAASSSSNLRRSPYLSSTTTTTTSRSNIDDQVTFSPQPSSSSSGLNHFVPTTSSTSTSRHPPSLLSSSLDSVSESHVVNLHGEISNPSSPLDRNSRPLLRPARSESPQAGPSGLCLK